MNREFPKSDGRDERRDDEGRSESSENLAARKPEAAAKDDIEHDTDVDPSGRKASEHEVNAVGRDGERHEAERDEPRGGGVEESVAPPGGEEVSVPRLGPPRRRRAKRLAKKPELPRGPLSPAQRLLLLDTWKRSGLPAADFAVLVGVSKHTLYAWRRRFKENGPAGLEDRPRGGPRGSRLPEVTKRAILLMKEEHPEWGTQRLSDMLCRGPALAASPRAVARVLHEAGYELEEVPTRRHRDRPRRFERARPNQLWQTDLFTFMLKRQNRRVYLVAFMDDHSRFIVGWGLHSTQSAPLVIEVLRSAVTNFNPPSEILTDNGSQYVTWRGKSRFARELERRGIKHIVARPRRPQTLGKVERFWGTLWREFLELAVFVDLEDARRRIGHFVSHYNFLRPHQGIDGLTPADRFFEAAPQVLDTLRRRVAENALEIARSGEPKKPFYLTGQLGDERISVHAEGDRVVVEREGREREEVDLTAPTPSAVTPSSIDAGDSDRVDDGDGSDLGDDDGEADEAIVPGAIVDRAHRDEVDRNLRAASVLLPGDSMLDRALEESACEDEESEDGDVWEEGERDDD